MSQCAHALPTCLVKPSADDQFVHCIGVDNLRETGGIEISCPRVHGDVAQVDVRPDGRETHVTEPTDTSELTVPLTRS